MPLRPMARIRRSMTAGRGARQFLNATRLKEVANGCLRLDDDGFVAELGEEKVEINVASYAIDPSGYCEWTSAQSACQVSNCIGVRVLVRILSDVDCLLGDCGHDADWFREALKDKVIRSAQSWLDPMDQI